jgi:hypothetical protein
MMTMTCNCRGGQRSSSACSASPMWRSMTEAEGRRQREAGDRRKNWHSILLNRSPDVPCHAVLCHAMLCYAMLCRAMSRGTVQCSAVQCSAVQCSAVQCSAVLLCNISASCSLSPPSSYRHLSKSFSPFLDYSCPRTRCVRLIVCKYCLMLY